MLTDSHVSWPLAVPPTACSPPPAVFFSMSFPNGHTMKILALCLLHYAANISVIRLFTLLRGAFVTVACQWSLPFWLMPVPLAITVRVYCVCASAFTGCSVNAGTYFGSRCEVNSLSTGNMWVGDRPPVPSPLPARLEGCCCKCQTGAQLTHWLRDPRKCSASGNIITATSWVVLRIK